MATINTAEHFGVSRDLGMIAPGRFADILLVPDLVNFRPTAVMAKGQWIARDGRWLIELPTVTYPEWALHSVHLKRPLTAEDFKLAVPGVQQGRVTANVIGVIENQAPTRHLRLTVEVTDGEIKPIFSVIL